MEGRAGLRVAFVLRHRIAVGGLQETSTSLAIALAERGVTVSEAILQPAPPGSHHAQRLREAGVDVTGPSRLAGLVLRFCPRQLRFLIVRSTWTRFLRRLPPGTIVHLVSSELGGAWVVPGARQRGLRVVVHEGNRLESVRLDSGLLAAAAQASGFLCHSADSAAALRQALPNHPPVEVYSPIIPDPRSVAAGSGGGPPVLAFHGQYGRHKGLEVLLDACAQLQSEGVGFQLKLAGSGPLGGALEELAAARGLAERVTIGGPIRQPRLGEWLGASDIAVLPSYSEGFPLALLEAMAHGLAIVTTAVGGIPERIRDGVEGLLVPPGDAGALAAALRRVIESAELRRRLGSAARAEFLAGHHTADEVVERMLAFYDRLNP